MSGSYKGVYWASGVCEVMEGVCKAEVKEVTGECQGVCKGDVKRLQSLFCVARGYEGVSGCAVLPRCVRVM